MIDSLRAKMETSCTSQTMLERRLLDTIHIYLRSIFDRAGHLALQRVWIVNYMSILIIILQHDPKINSQINM